MAVTRRTFVSAGATLALSLRRRLFATSYAPSQGLATCAPSADAPDEDLIYFDSYNLPVQRDCDGGDSAQRLGWMWLGIFLRNRLGKPWHITPPAALDASVDLLEPKSNGDFIRHPLKWNDPKDFSRDQSLPLVAAMGVWSEPTRLDRMWRGVVQRLYRFQNGDLCAPEHINLFRRARALSPQQLGDLQLVGSSVARTALGLNLDDVGDDLNHIVSLMIARVRSPTPTVDLAIRIYAKHRPHSYGSYLGSYRKAYGFAYDTSAAVMIDRMKRGIAGGWRPDKNVPPSLGALRWYFRRESNGAPALAELYAPIVQYWLS
jgi:hypothetical protein